ncbi:AraC family transcriptional regulator [Ktedonobacter sp. SOSP1-52]|uniref:AraC family transcriptional regulator n=1 Tax=Ktedonobacter sp. SOSP1-52 TaxID=2778366 RepID=UPI0019167942|nr:AraC family transcriptional regulator [Ktedonobacter sp. SOSP1-52]GHO62459.1 AraC family transcriptional regulator [Ktedonobacter sp. SOSP1-52]
MDILTNVLNTLELKGWLGSRTEVSPPWRFDFLASQDSIFHIFNFGGGYLHIEGDATPLRVEDGDVVVFPHGQAHTICDEPTSPLTQAAVHLDYDAHGEYEIYPFEGEGTQTVLLCGAFHFENPSNYPLLQNLPKVIHIPGEQGRMVQGFANIVSLLAYESTLQQAGTEVMLRRLTEMLFIQVIRVWIAQQATGTEGWLAALRDQPISTALGLIHKSPERGWKVEELAEAVALSRSAFSSRFTQLVGEPPMKYLTHWRMHMATHLLKQGVEVEKIAQRLGYESEVAFRKAFKREVGIPPARYRKLA